ncbi:MULTISPECIES: hypothetical protein [unclassified Flavobacterium]|uniref:DUF7878 domain-containing protein n=1 Tax=unclassified Flavobacterium TaxID=196869 RepID=UPI001F140783|nr:MULTISPECIES: hypothetical protein [unclassified Flavobacterium]UMY66524.1 hypothetical protein MKO97_03835 [Flavobacterium sp. HJ-32-4]
MMQITFDITRVPDASQQRYPVAYLEGRLQIAIGPVIFFDEPEIPLIEFAISAYEWLRNTRNGQVEDFVYLSVDHEEPIITFRRVADGLFSPHSIWQLEAAEPINANDLGVAFETYIAALQDALKTQRNIDFDSLLEAQ